MFGPIKANVTDLVLHHLRARCPVDASHGFRSVEGIPAAVGGEDTLGVAAKFAAMGVNVVGVPKTIDKDLAAADEAARKDKT